MGAERIGYVDGETPLEGLLFRPTEAPRAAAAVFPTIMNTTPAVEAKAQALAEAGYLAMVCDLYGRTPADFAQSQDWAGELTRNVEMHRAQLYASLAALRIRAEGLPLLAIGFCMGGQAVLELARSGADLRAVASFHGLLQTLAPAQPDTVRARILVCHGYADPLVPREHVIAFWEEMDRAGADWHFHAYGKVKHGFTNPNPPPDNGVVDYDASADRQSWAAMLNFFDEVLG
ncbi:dienelactone hydrolase family protein [Qipengyuania sp. XHP0207]|uniref:dienelactone hydrolase family protein n=1 Tax=Qipengyuania sp. XHP0207 TaxID=3038078 RepID=UPI00241D264B|nr:dienelactone hydrolase family protein [Qipengyuania sp. XHP0207]MDG5749388.1 dienelactone hydrolase family protein [Qipengyuania sp. XHP0207]